MLTFFCSSYGESITLVVSESKIRYSIHKDLLFGSSPVFEEQYKSAIDNIILWPKEDPLIIIKAMCHWMYHDQLCVPGGLLLDESRVPYSTNGMFYTKQFLFVALFFVAEKHKILDLGNDAIDELLEESSHIMFCE